MTLKGIDVIQKIAQQPKAMGDRPTTDIKMWVKLMPVKKAMVTSMYGFDYLTSSFKPELIKK
jgi:peptidyl-prolyl cis-trans isomerase B (cyclophilin B)